MINFDPDTDNGAAPTPCINVCTMNSQSGLCEGCFRTLDEIVQWGTASEETKRQIWVEIRRRQEALF